MEKNKDEVQLRQQLSSIKIEDRGIQFTLTPEYVRDHMYCAVINTEKNMQLLERCPHESFADLSVVAKCDIGAGRKLFVTEEFVQLLRMSGEEIVSMQSLILKKQAIPARIWARLSNVYWQMYLCRKAKFRKFKKFVKYPMMSIRCMF